MGKEKKPDIGLHLLKVGNFKWDSYEWSVVSYLIRLGDAPDIIYQEVPRLPLFNKLNDLGLEVLYDSKARRMYLTESSLNNYYENVIGGKYEEEKSYVQRRSGAP